jgi:6-pyruvoyltetrahydropterin/6-carboxytetrahydropterin synthase
MEIGKTFTVEAAHLLPNVPPGHKCSRLHGHSFGIEVWVEGEMGAESGWVVDYAVIDQAFAPLFDQLDHHYMNEIEGLENPTSEHLARWIWVKLSPALKGLCKIVIRETCTTACVYRGEGAGAGQAPD